MSKNQTLENALVFGDPQLPIRRLQTRSEEWFRKRVVTEVCFLSLKRTQGKAILRVFWQVPRTGLETRNPRFQSSCWHLYFSSSSHRKFLSYCLEKKHKQIHSYISTLTVISDCCHTSGIFFTSYIIIKAWCKLKHFHSIKLLIHSGKDLVISFMDAVKWQVLHLSVLKTEYWTALVRYLFLFLQANLANVA